ncbi:MAG: AMIN domain-containing protein, partial [Acidobacteriales bacterium]|nr:AMIN domain-containing protein [Terriglobales bacterium]
MKTWPHGVAAHHRSLPVFWFSLIALIFSAFPLSASASVHKSAAWARAQFETATHLHEALDARASEDRSRADYQRVIDSYRRVYFGAPNSPKAEPSVAAVAQLLAEMGRGFEDRSILRSAISQYEFLRRQYPGGKGASEALLAIGQIYKDDLSDFRRARQTFEEFVAKYPRNRFAGEARQALAEIAASGNSRLTATIPKAGGIPQLHSGEVSNRPSTEASKSGKLAQVTGIRTWSTPDSTRVAIDLESDVQYESQRIDNPKRIVFDLLDTKLSPALVSKTFNVDDEFLKRIRLAQTVAGRTRIVMEVDEQSDFRASQLDDPPRLMIDIHADQKSANVGRTAARKPLGPVSGIGSPKKVIVEAEDEDQDSASQPATGSTNQHPSESAAGAQPGSGTAAQDRMRLKTQAAAPISS